ncbi:MAG TPA: TIGR03088 family PEP-CTERM/XrtA system glycosyltransferase [Rhodocyclaceae bacterium]|nr:TIGR03088 family PEP-CTERM/XrtA system glycosyltransferase [Rhodocyclaceae bacterium]
MSALHPDGRLLVMHVVYSFAVGGLENGVVNLINRMDRTRFRHIVVALTQCEPLFCARVQVPDVEFVALHKPPGQGVKIYPALFRLFRAYRPDVVHTRNLAALEATVPAWVAGVPVRIHGEHGWDVSDPHGTRAKFRWMRRLYRPFVTHYIALSGQILSYLVRAVGIPDRRAERICNGVDVARFTPRGARRAALEGSPFNDPAYFVIGTVGRLQAVKDQLNLMRAFARMRQLDATHSESVRLVLAGDGPLRGRIEDEIRTLGLNGRVWMAGERSDVPRMMSGFDLFVLPSQTEGISNTILEAMAAGLPVVATDVGGNGELVADGESGALVPPQDSQRLADKLLEYVRDPLRGRAEGHAGRLRVEANFSLDGMVKRYADLYLALCAAKGR